MISDNVVILTTDEFRERLEAEFRRGAESTLDNLEELLKRAALHSPHNTGVIYSTDGTGRIQITSTINNELGDCLTVRWMPESAKGTWYAAHFSPARARIIARELVRRAALLEEVNGVAAIDPIPEAMHKGPVGI